LIKVVDSIGGTSVSIPRLSHTTHIDNIPVGIFQRKTGVREKSNPALFILFKGDGSVRVTDETDLLFIAAKVKGSLGEGEDIVPLLRVVGRCMN
jgi:hypothetical protein